MPSILPPWTDADPVLHARLGDAIDPDRKVLEGLERIVPLSGKRIADIGTGIGHYPMILARRTGRTYGIESDPELLAEARRRAAGSHQPNIRIVEGEPTIEGSRALLPVGSVDTVIERVVHEIRTLKPVHYCFQTQMGDFDPPTRLKQLALWAKVIIPTVQQEIANDPPHVAAPAAELAAA